MTPSDPLRFYIRLRRNYVLLFLVTAIACLWQHPTMLSVAVIMNTIIWIFALVSLSAQIRHLRRARADLSAVHPQPKEPRMKH